jgi:hypothetical protein
VCDCKCHQALLVETPKNTRTAGASRLLHDEQPTCQATRSLAVQFISVLYSVSRLVTGVLSRVKRYEQYANILHKNLLLYGRVFERFAAVNNSHSL